MKTPINKSGSKWIPHPHIGLRQSCISRCRGCRLALAVDAVDHKCDGAVTGHIAGSAETVHRDVEGYHHSLLIGRETEDRL